MRLLTWLTRLFIDTFGITHPRPEQERMASLLIGGLLLLFVLAVVGLTIAFLIFFGHLH